MAEMGKRTRARALAIIGALGVGALLAPGGCGAKTGLRVPDRDAGEVDGPGQTPLTCGTFSIKAELAALDLFIAMDTSGSMDEPTADGTRKIEAARTALEAFLKAPESNGIGVTIAFFPLVDLSVPELCGSDVACNLPGACEPLFICYPSGETFCATDVDCPGGNTCERLGFCGGAPTQMCVIDELPCASGAMCVPGGWCENHIICEPTTYEPLADPQVLPGGATQVIAALAGKTPEGGTPTLPALRGSIQAAIRNSQENPSHKSVVLLATDGFPTSCDPAIPSPSQNTDAGIPAVVAAAKEGNAGGVQTFVVGVFTPEEAQLAQQNLDAIADAGGSQDAYVITTNSPVAQQLLAAFTEIRVAASDCDYALPRAGDEPLDATKMKIRLTGPFGERWLERKNSLAECDPVTGGYVFDKDPFGPEPPARVQLCPASCSLVRSDPGIDIEVIVDCEDASR